MTLVDCVAARHANAILEIFNDAIAHSTALYDYQSRTPEDMARWFDGKTRGRYPVIGVENDAGDLLGFASYGPFRAWPAYKYTIEHSVYVHRDHWRKGVARELMTRLIAEAERQSYHVMVAGIDAANSPSIALHEQLGFARCGVIHHAGFKFGRWLDLVFYELQLRTPARPVDG